MDVAHWYHVYAAGDWHDPVTEHLAALDDTAFDGYFGVGIIGTLDQRGDAYEHIQASRQPSHTIFADTGWEQATLTWAHAWAKDHDDGAVMYAHTKGAHDPSPINIAWRRHMTRHLVRGWQANANHLDDQHDAIGCHWLTETEFPGIIADTPFPMFGGNYWIATCRYLSQLPPCATRTRHDAEAWVGLGNPRIIDLTPGWPGNYQHTTA